MGFMPRTVKNGISCDNNLLVVFKGGLMHALVTVPYTVLPTSSIYIKKNRH